LMAAAFSFEANSTLDIEEQDDGLATEPMASPVP